MAKERGFTLVGMLLVLAIIGVIAAVLLPALSDAGYDAKIRKIRADLRSIRNALQYYYMQHGAFPDVKQKEWEDPARNPVLFLKPRLVDRIPEDPFSAGNVYQYELYLGKDWNEAIYVVYTRGPQGNGTASFKNKEPDRVTIRNGATMGYVTNAGDVILAP